MKFDGQLKGFDELDVVFRDLPLAARRRVYRAALSYAATPVVRAAKQNVSSNKIRRNIVKKLNRAKSALGELTVSVITRKAYNPRTNVGDKRIMPYGDKDAFFSVWYEFGKRGFAATEYLEKAWLATRDQAFQRFAKQVGVRIEAEVKKLAKIKK